MGGLFRETDPCCSCRGFTRSGDPQSFRDARLRMSQPLRLSARWRRSFSGFCAASGCDAMLGGILFPRRSYIGRLLGRFRCDAWVDRGSAAKLHRRGDCYFGSPAPGGLAGALFHRLVSPQVRDDCSTPTSARVAGLVLAQFAVFASRLRMFEIPRRSFSIRILLSVARADHFFSLSDPEP